MEDFAQINRQAWNAWTKVNKSCAVIVKAVIDLKAQMKINVRS